LFLSSEEGEEKERRIGMKATGLEEAEMKSDLRCYVPICE
jgi:hypothetical protein